MESKEISEEECNNELLIAEKQDSYTGSKYSGGTNEIGVDFHP